MFSDEMSEKPVTVAESIEAIDVLQALMQRVQPDQPIMLTADEKAAANALLAYLRADAETTLESSI